MRRDVRGMSGFDDLTSLALIHFVFTRADFYTDPIGNNTHTESSKICVSSNLDNGNLPDLPLPFFLFKDRILSVIVAHSSIWIREMADLHCVRAVSHRFGPDAKISRSYFRHDLNRRFAPTPGVHPNQCQCLQRLLIRFVECARASGRCKGEVFGRTRPSAAMCMQKPRQCNRCSRRMRARGGEARPAGGASGGARALPPLAHCACEARATVSASLSPPPNLRGCWSIWVFWWFSMSALVWRF